jgi:ATP-dependent DNA helicase RecG
VDESVVYTLAMRRDDLIQLLGRLSTTRSEDLESTTVEFKEYRDEQALHNAKDLAEEACALANTNGGVVVVGVRDSSNLHGDSLEKQVVGFPTCDILTLRERLAGKLKPHLELQVFELQFEGKNLLVIDVPPKRDGLVATSSGKVYTREGRSSRPMGPDEIERSVKTLQTYDWSGDDVDISPAEGLDPEAVAEAKAEFIRSRGLDSLDDAAFLEAVEGTKNGVLTKACILFLGKEQTIRDHLGDFEFRFTWRTSAGTLIINDIWYGCLWKAIQRTRLHFEKCNSSFTLEDGGKKYQIPAMDPQAFHEAFLNALVHRDYAVDGMVSVQYESGTLVISSPGGFYGGVTADNIVRHEPRHRNKALARVLMLFHMIDRAGVGVMRMGIHSLRYGRGFPRFAEKNGYVQVEMEAEYFRPGIFVLVQTDGADYSVADLLVLNSLFEQSAVPVGKLVTLLSKVEDQPWEGLQAAVKKVKVLQFSGDKNGVYVSVKTEWRNLFKVTRVFRTREASDKHVKLFGYLVKHGEASNTDITALFEYAHTSQTSRFLKRAKYVKRSGNGPNIRWSLRSELT